MKKLFTILVVVALSTSTTFAQAGSFAIGVGSDMAEKSWQDYSLTPSLGYFIADNMLVGMHFGFSSSEDNTKKVTTSMMLAPYFRYYLNDYLFANASIGISSGSEKEDGADESTTTGGFDLGVGAGLSLMWNDKIAIEPSLGLAIGSTSETPAGGDELTTSDFGIVMGLGITLFLDSE